MFVLCDNIEGVLDEFKVDAKKRKQVFNFTFGCVDNRSEAEQQLASHT